MANDNYTAIMGMNLSEYSGKWIAVCNKEIVSSGDNIKKVLGEARNKCPKQTPLVTKVPSGETMIF
ncbi:MAG: DUF5678 domain-containing protein [Candidatus Woesearchaeota archaeon]